MTRILLILLLFAPYAQAQRPSAQSQSQPRAHSQSQPPGITHPLNVGDIPFDPGIDDPQFQLNDSTRVFQYYNSNSWWLDHKDAYHDLFIKATGKWTAAPTQSGWLTIRFIVNTAGQTGRYRALEMDSVYQPFHFDPRLTANLLATVKTAHWEPAHYHGKVYDTYQYITFHLERGRLVDIMP